MQEIREIREIQNPQNRQSVQEITSGQPSPTPTAETTWQSPEYEVVDTALEVTAYALATR
jgi:coenzyme PQQ precursor peptide PqqA